MGGREWTRQRQWGNGRWEVGEVTDEAELARVFTRVYAELKFAM